MTSKSRRKRSKQPLQAKKARGKQSAPLAANEKQAASTAGTAAVAKRDTTPQNTPATASARMASHGHISAEIRRIGMLAAIMISVLVVLAYTIS